MCFFWGMVLRMFWVIISIVLKLGFFVKFGEGVIGLGGELVWGEGGVEVDVVILWVG